jgi:flagellar M-ring protein FliF
MDSNGKLLSQNSDAEITGSANNTADYRERIENNYSRKVESMLTTVLGAGRATVKVSADIDMNSISIVKEDYEPKGVPTKEEIQSESETGPGTYTKNGEEKLPGMSKTSEIITNEMVVGKTIIEEVKAPGRIKSLRVAAFVDLNVRDANGQSSGEKIMEVSAVESIIQNALGLEDTSDIKVVDVKFNREKILDDKDEGLKLDYAAIAGQASMGIMAVCALLALKILGSGKNKAVETAGQANQISAGASAGYLPAGEQRESSAQQPRADMLGENIANAMKENPEQAKKLFANWAEEKD